MSEKQLIIHVGFHKSGTSALQESFSNQHEELRKHGILYPDIQRTAHHRLAFALTQRYWGWKTRGGHQTSFGVWARAARRINRSRFEKIVLSSEFFSELNDQQIQQALRSIKNRQVKILFTLRPLVKLLSSSYQQYLKYGTKADYETWLHSVLDEPGISKINPTFWKRHMHGEVVTRWAKAVGSENVTVIIVDEKSPDFLFDCVNELLGIPKGLLQSQQTGSNRSLTLEEISLLLHINNNFPKDRQWDDYLVFIRNGYIRHLTDHVKVSENKEKLPTPTWAVEKANKIASASKNQLVELGVKILGDIDSLDKARVIEGVPSYSRSIDIEVVSQAMLNFSRATAKRFPLSWLIRAVLSKLKKLLSFN